MNFYLEKENRQYLKLLLLICAGMTGLVVLLSYFTLLQVQELVFLREQQIVSSLLSDGIAAEAIAAACSRTEISGEGLAFLYQTGHQKQTPVWFFSFFRTCTHAVFLPLFAGCLFFCACLFLAAVWYMQKRDRLYQQAAELVEQFAEGNFSGHLPAGDQRGTIYRLFDSIDQLARTLKSRCETEQASRQFLNNMISDISHQIKTPLAALNLYMDIMDGEPDHPDTIRTFTAKSTQSLRRMEELIQSLLKIARLDAGQITFDRTYVPVRELAAHGAEHLQTRAEQEGKYILIEGNSSDEICCDPVWTAEAVGNLVKNALDHTEEGGRIRIFWEYSPAMIRLSVEDNGCGIAQEDIHHIFKRFYRSSRSSDRQGAGLGLSLSRAIIEGQGGTLSVRSQPGEGAVFCISFLQQKERLS